MFDHLLDKIEYDEPDQGVHQEQNEGQVPQGNCDQDNGEEEDEREGEEIGEVADKEGDEG